MKIAGALVVLMLMHIFYGIVDAQGSWKILNRNAGIACMHAAATHYNTLIMLDRTNTGPSQIRLAGGKCRYQPLERILKNDCWAHSVMMNPVNGAVRPLTVQTDTWCSSGQFFDNGIMVQTGGDFEGLRKIRTLKPCQPGGNCDWVELAEPLAKGRWYASNQLLQSGTRQIIVGGRNEPTYEFYPKRRAGEGAYYLSVLDGCCDNLYPFVFLLPNNLLFIFANKDSVSLNWETGKVVRKFPTLPGNPRNYPSAGSAVMLPVSFTTGFTRAEILVCGGSADGASRTNNVGAACSNNCGRIMATAAAGGWAMENMPIRRCMGDMINMPNGEVLIINGAMNGFQGWGKASDAVLNPVNYKPTATTGRRFAVWAKTGIPRMYHSTASLLSDGRVIVAGSNTHQFYTYTGAFPTELRVEAFSPPYLGANYNAYRPAITGAPIALKYNQIFTMTFTVGVRRGVVTIFQNNAPFTTHSFSQGQRSLHLRNTVPIRAGAGWSTQVTAVPGNSVAPPAWYMFFIVQNGIPSNGKWIKQNN